MLKESGNRISYLQRVIDGTIVLLCWLCSYVVRFSLIDGAQQGLFLDFFKVGVLLSVISIYFFDKNGLYSSQRFTSRYKEILSTLKANFLSFVALIVILYFFKIERLSRIHLTTYLTLSSFLLTSNRIIIRNLIRNLRSRGKNLRHILLIGDGENIIKYVNTVRAYKDSGINFIGWLDSGNKSTEYKINEIIEEYSEFIKTNNPDAIVISYSGEKQSKQSAFIKENYNDVTPIQVLPDISFSLVGHTIDNFAGIPILTFNQPHISQLNLLLKRLSDLITSFIGLIIISPLMILIALAVKLSSPGPIFYAQERVGLNGRKFKMWKFRSMKIAASGEDKITWSSKEDPRKTKIGSFIRKTSIDELPQLWNVITGDMSLVGPRPERPFFVDKFKEEIPNYMLRHKMKAGITGWAQINGWRGDTDLTKRIECDIYYIRNWSLALDVKILFLTLVKGFINKNAY